MILCVLKVFMILTQDFGSPNTTFFPDLDSAQTL